MNSATTPSSPSAEVGMMTEPGTDDIDRFQQIESIFAALCDLSDHDAQLRLTELSGGDQEIIDSVRAMIDADRKEYPALDSGVFLEQHDDTPIPETIGEYQILGILGEGGMGVVYEAMQSNPSRPVALKIIRERSMHAKIRRRFQSEADILAKLNHPGIATIYSSGTAEGDHGSTPYVAMELVVGISITEYCKSKNLDNNERIRLLRDVCRAVGHAHQHGVIHRDLKPSNILVDQSGSVKVLDFGIAVDISIQDRTQMTQTGQLIGTLKYMAPEQVDRKGGSGSTQSDVYALGLIGYEILTGQSPLEEFNTSMFGMVRAIGERDHTMLGTIDRSFRGDIETVIAKALERETDRRYEDAGQLADDLDRFLQSKPVLARKPSGWYQFRKFSKRNPFIVGAAASVLIVMVVSLVLISNALRQANQERFRAQTEQRNQELINAYLLEDLFSAADPLAGGDPDVTLLDAMRSSSPMIAQRFKEAPEAHASISFTVGDQFRLMNDYDKALEHLTKSVEISEQLGLPIDVQINRRNGLADAYMDIDRLDTALQLVQETNTIIRANSEISPEIKIDTLIQHGSLVYHKREFESAVGFFEQAAKIGRELAPDYSGTQDSLAALATIYTSIERYDEALNLHLEVIGRSIQDLGSEHPATLVSQDNLAILYYRLGEHQKSMSLLEDVLEIRLRVFGLEHVKTYLTIAGMGRNYMALARYEEAEDKLLQANEGLTRIIGADHRYTKLVHIDLANMYSKWGKGEKAKEYAAEN